MEKDRKKTHVRLRVAPTLVEHSINSDMTK
jgi:hypothetical protein